MSKILSLYLSFSFSLSHAHTHAYRGARTRTYTYTQHNKTRYLTTMLVTGRDTSKGRVIRMHPKYAAFRNNQPSTLCPKVIWLLVCNALTTSCLTEPSVPKIKTRGWGGGWGLPALTSRCLSEHCCEDKRHLMFDKHMFIRLSLSVNADHKNLRLQT